MSTHFQNTIVSEAELREVIGMPSELVIRKQMPTLSAHALAFIAASPFVLLGTSSAAGALDVSPRGDLPGFVFALDDRTLVMPERPGNRRIDSMRNIIENPQVGLLFIIPGTEETLRVNGRACISRDEALLERTTVQGKRSTVVIGVDVQECFFHCPKAFKRSHLWNAAHWPERSSLPTLGRIIVDQFQIQHVTAEQIDCDLEEDYKQSLY